MPQFTIEGRLATISDIQRNFLFEYMIPNINVMTNNIIDMENLIIRIKTASIPGRTNENIDSFFMGMKQLFPGRPGFSNTMVTNIDETEDNIIGKGLYAWQQRIFDIDPNSATAGYSQVPTKRLASTDVILRMYKYNGEKIGDDDIVLVNTRPTNVEDISLDMASNEKIVYAVTWTYDFWYRKKIN
jgi:hypothetical protein